MFPSLAHPALAHCRRLFLHGFTVDANIGVHDFEKGGAQRLIIDVDWFVPLAATTPTQDKLQEVADYDFIATTIHHHIRQGHINLQETLCDELVRTLLEHPLTVAVRVATAKPDVYPNCQAVGVEVFRIRI